MADVVGTVRAGGVAIRGKEADMSLKSVEVVLISPLPFSDVQRVGWRKTSGAMTQEMLRSDLVSCVWLVEAGMARGTSARVRQVAQNLTVVSLPTVYPLERFRWIRDRNRSVQARMLRDVLPKTEGPRVAWFYDWYPIEVLGQLPWDALVGEVTDAADEFVKGGERGHERLERVRQLCRERCDLLSCVAPGLAAECSGGRARSLVEGNGIDREFLDAAALLSTRPSAYDGLNGKILLVVGGEWSTSVRMDFGLLTDALQRLQGWTLVVVGCGSSPSAALRRLLGNPRVRALPIVPRRDLIPLIQHADVCCVPYRPGIARRDSLKVYEYLACGKPVVLTADDVAPALAGGGCRVSGAADFAEACQSMAGGLAEEVVRSLRKELEARTSDRRLSRILTNALPSLAPGELWA
jgi:glycosyltransferase involved in cell wall biosynthesis